MSKPYTTTEMLADMRDPRYATDENFRSYVMSRLGAGDVDHGGRAGPIRPGVISDGAVGFDKGASNAGGFTVKIGSDHRESGGVSRVGIDPDATYHGPLGSAYEIARAINNPEYAKNPAYREEVVAALAQLEPTGRPKF